MPPGCETEGGIGIKVCGHLNCPLVVLSDLKVGHSCVMKRIGEVCLAIFQENGDEMLSCHCNEELWREIESVFSSRVNTLNTVLVLNRTWLAIRCPTQYKTAFFKPLLMNLCNRSTA